MVGVTTNNVEEPLLHIPVEVFWYTSIDRPLIRGPFGLWTFPILNALIIIVINLRGYPTTNTSEKKGIKTYQFVRDEKGRIIEIVEIER